MSMDNINLAEFKFYLQSELGIVYEMGYGSGYTKISDDKSLITDVVSSRIIQMLSKCIKEEKDADLSGN